MAQPKVLNYTTGVEAEKTVGEITAILVAHKARRIATDFDDAGRPVAMTFSLGIAGRGEASYRLPSRVDRVLDRLQHQHKAGQVQRRYVTREQALRIGWRILKDWVESQLNLIALGMAEVDEVMLSYQLTPDGKHTMFEVYAEKKQLEGPR